MGGRGETTNVLHLLGAESDAGDRCVRAELLGEVPRGSADATAHIKHSLRGVALSLTIHRDFPPLGHLVDEIVLGLDEALAECTLSPIFLAVVPQVYVLPPVAFKNAVLKS